jgi:uncharacterized protein
MEIKGPAIETRIALTEKPSGRNPVMYHKWRDLLFLHWSLDPAEVQKTLPPGLHVDTYDSKAYIGIVPFYMCAVRPRFIPPLPYISNFLELNTRTYVYDDKDNPGVWFYSLDANRRIAVAAARLGFGLPYFVANMKASKDKETGEVRFFSQRSRVELEKASTFRYRSGHSLGRPQLGTLEFFLVERYLLFSAYLGTLWKGRVYHENYPLMEAEVPEWDLNLFEINGLEPPVGPPDHCHYSPGVDVDIFLIQKV